MSYGERRCNSCRFLRHEEGPHGSGAMRCMRPGPRYGRTVDYSERDLFGTVHTPVWCDFKEEQHE